ncbi:MAG TPA: DNA polymerase III subunit epsilon [Alphaproteobacteria bacterium]|nr:DNA polymerase III subunit epsilon [Alphaproteobacteria bacterium]
MREIVFDTETTGLDPEAGHRIIEIAAIELVNHLPTGRNFHRYVNPEREIAPEAQAIHGMKLADLADKPVFANIVAELLEFLGDARLVAHNAEFDVKFLNAELKALGFPPLPMARALDTVQMARRKFPGAPASLDALCQRFGVDNTHRTLHGALLDAELLSEVYLELIGGRQAAMLLDAGTDTGGLIMAPIVVRQRPPREVRPHAPSPEELAAHAALLAKLKNPLWAS